MLKSKLSLPIAWLIFVIVGFSADIELVAQTSSPENAASVEEDSFTGKPLSTDPVTGKAAARAFRIQSIRGTVVWYGEALRKQLGIQTVDEASERVLAIATKNGQLLPIIEDLRGRSFRVDERLRQMDVELLVRRYDTTPAVQIIRVYEWRDGQKYQVDYWCDVCAIVMFETGPCACCQDHNRLRQRKVEE